VSRGSDRRAVLGGLAGVAVAQGVDDDHFENNVVPKAYLLYHFRDKRNKYNKKKKG
jgi:hypothetical protein